MTHFADKRQLGIFPNVYPCVRLSDMIQVPEVQILHNMSVALNLCFVCNPGSPSQSSSIRRKTCHAPNTATPQHDSSSCE